MSNTSATGGYLTPTSTEPIPGGLTLIQFIQTVIVGISGYAGTLVRPDWQVAPPKQPDIGTDWIAFGLAIKNPSANAYVWLDEDDNEVFGRQSALDVRCQFYGPNAQENIAAFQDGFQVQQNLEALRLADMGYTGITPAVRNPDLVNERWIDRYETTVTLCRRTVRTYAVLPFVSVAGMIHTVVAGDDVSDHFTSENSREKP